jgi:hypothetical protein
MYALLWKQAHLQTAYNPTNRVMIIQKHTGEDQAVIPSVQIIIEEPVMQIRSFAGKSPAARDKQTRAAEEMEAQTQDKTPHKEELGI